MHNPLIRNTWHVLKTARRQADGPPSALNVRVLEQRGFSSDEIEAFLKPQDSARHDPFFFQEMETACRQLHQIAAKQGRVLVYGDYDADGLTATALLVRFLRAIEVRCDYMIPDRLQDGYGLSEEAVAQITAAAPDLVITVDCGSISTAEIHALQDSNIPVIVTDHHECQGIRPPAAAFINPKHEQSGYPFSGLSGVGTVFKFVEAYRTRFMSDGPDLQQFLPLVAIGTIADAMPLIDENRRLVQLGLELFLTKGLPGLTALFQLCCPDRSKPTSEDIGFRLAPRLNAAGRMGRLEPALTLLLSDDVQQVEVAARTLDQLNQARRAEEADILQSVAGWLENHPDVLKHNILVVWGDDWHAGVLGIVSSRLADIYKRPVITLSRTNQVYKGSARSFGTFDILQALAAAESSLEQYGGHQQAAGLTVLPEQLPAFIRQITQWADQQTDLDLQFVITADLDLTEQTLTEETIRSLSRLEPFGLGNERPVFLDRNLLVEQIRTVGDGSHLQLSVRRQNQQVVRCIGFGLGKMSGLYRPGDRIDLMVHLGWHVWRGQGSCQFQLIDLRPAHGLSVFEDEPERVEAAYIKSGSIQAVASLLQLTTAELMPQKQLFEDLYRFLSREAGRQPLVFDLPPLARKLTTEYNRAVNSFMVSRVLQILAEAGLLDLRSLQENRYVVQLIQPAGRVRISDTLAWRQLSFGFDGGEEQ